MDAGSGQSLVRWVPGHSPEPRLFRTFEFYGLFRTSSHSKHGSSLRTVVLLLHDAEFMTEPGVRQQVLLEFLWQCRPLRGQELHRVSVPSCTKWQRGSLGVGSQGTHPSGKQGKFPEDVVPKPRPDQRAGDGRERVAQAEGPPVRKLRAGGPCLRGSMEEGQGD